MIISLFSQHGLTWIHHAGSLHILLDKFQRVFNCSARLFAKLLNLPISLIYNLYWLSVCFHIVSGTAPPHLSELIHRDSPFQSLHSASGTWIFHVPRMGRMILWERSCQYIRPVIWNSSSPSGICRYSLESKLKTPLFYILICHFLSSHSNNQSPVLHVFVVCLCVRERERKKERKRSTSLYVFVSAPGFYKMGQHK